MSNEIANILDDIVTREANRREKMLKIIKEEYPAVDLEGKLVTGSFVECRVYLDNLKYIKCDGLYAYDVPTQLALDFELMNKFGWEYTTFEIGPTLYVVERPVSHRTAVREYDPKTGSPKKGKRCYRAVHETSKGQYIEIKGKRVYLSFPDKEEAVETKIETAVKAENIEVKEGEIQIMEKSKIVKLYREDQGFNDLIKEARGAKVVDSDYSRNLSAYATTISQANGFVYTVVENIDPGVYYSVEKKQLKTFTVMLEDGDVIEEGPYVEVTGLIDSYRPDDGGPGYDVVKVMAPSFQEVIRKTSDGLVYQGDDIDEAFISCWNPVSDDEGGK